MGHGIATQYKTIYRGSMAPLITYCIIKNWGILNHKSSSSSSTTSTHIFGIWMLVYVLERTNMKDDLYLGLNNRTTNEYKTNTKISS